MARVLIFACNAGVSLSEGGGSRFILTLARFLAERGENVTLAGFHSLDPAGLAEVHGKFDHVEVMTTAVKAGFGLARKLPFKLSAYFGTAFPGFETFISRSIEKARPDTVWFNDEIPRAAQESLNGAFETRTYVHYPYFADHPDDVIDFPLLLGRNLVRHPETYGRVYANGTVTRNAMHRCEREKAEVLFPYVRSEDPVTHNEKKDWIVSLGAISPVKRHHDIVRAFAASGLGEKGAKLFVCGYVRNILYASKLRRLVEQTPGAQMLVGPDRELLEMILQRAKGIVSAADFEPFGLGLLEAVEAGAVPVVKRSNLNGGWVDITKWGQFGLGFADSKALETSMTTVVENYSELAPTLDELLARPDFSHDNFARAIR